MTSHAYYELPHAHPGLLNRLDELIIWARMNFKPQKSRSLSLRKGERNDRVTFTIGGKTSPHRGPAHPKPGKTIYISSLRQGYGENHPSAAFRRPVKD
ncbi:hypothetical protein AAFF_G00328300 [Aldrovandia affinis]|uniref:Uncharacterized protein n=1 Tax=Aldrovandia affinis TaxID=143900 RepID=A0AAD7X1H3_9TELE|nr:hypothetical protein AAFF_G00328300 [Aldrovandia affinis]